MSDDVVITVEHVSKTFKLPHEKTSSIKSAVINFYRRKRTFEQQQALKDISLEVKKGEFFGIVGRNGSGKSTLLKLLAGIYSLSQGRIEVKGKLTPFIELGVGFSPELTGRENIFLNGALLGFNRAEMEAMYDDIVNFAELERFMDQKLKNYSSGMQVRLAFSIAIRAKSDILLLDEVLAVGDESFQRKCLDVFEDYKRRKQTVILVTHDMETVKRFCTTAVLINDGVLLDYGDPMSIADKYSRLNQEHINAGSPVADLQQESDLSIKLIDKKGDHTAQFEYGKTLVVDLSWPEHKKVQNAGVSIYTSLGERVYATNTFVDQHPVRGHHLRYSVKLNLGSGNYYVMAGTFLDRPERKVDFISHGPVFTIKAEKLNTGEGIARLEHSWSEG
jgi:ABC-2 type transport system ATP-binding protein